MLPQFRNMITVVLVFFVSLHMHACEFQATDLILPLSKTVATVGEATVDRVAVDIDGTSFTIPSSCEWKTATTPELTTWPIVATWDDQGNLVVAESVWNRESVQAQLKSRPHRIVRLIDTDKDGMFDRRQVVAEQFSFPEGVLCLGNDLLVAAPPEIWRLHDADGDGVYESREIWFDGTTLTGCANDLHGPWLGPDGWVYWSKSAFAEQTHEIRSGEHWKSTASHLYRRHPNGGPIEPVMTGGMDNMVDVAWLPNGERFFCATFLHHPRFGFRDGLGHAMYGSVFGKPHDVLRNHPKTGPLMEPLVELGPAAPAGLHYVPHVSLPSFNSLDPDANANFAGCLLSAQFNLQKIGLHALKSSREQSAYQAESVDVVTCNRVDFHPVDILSDRDGSLIVVDTGGWYDLCCPSSGTDQRIARGGIYRLSGLTPTNLATTKSSALAKNLKVNLGELRNTIFDARQPASIRLAAFHEASKRLTKDETDSDISKLIRDCAECDLADLRIAAMNIGSLYRMEEIYQPAVHELSKQDSRCARLAAECLGRVGNKNSVGPLMTAMKRHDMDRSLEHAIIYALIELKAEDSVRTYLHSEDARQQVAAMIVLQQNERFADSDSKQLLHLVGSQNERARSLAVEVLAQHSNWASTASAFLQDQWDQDSETSRNIIEQIGPAWVGNQEIAGLMSRWMAQSNLSSNQRTSIIRILQRLPTRTLPELWSGPLSSIIRSARDTNAVQLAEALHSLQIPSSSSIAIAIQERIGSGTASEKLMWMGAMPRSTAISENDWSVVLKSLASEDLDERKSALRALGRVSLDGKKVQTLTDHFVHFSPIELRSVIDAVLRSNQSDADSILLTKLLTVPAAKTLDVEFVAGLLKNRSESQQSLWRTELNHLNQPPENIAHELDRWLEKIPEGDPKNGYHVFRSSKAACSACHQVGYVGGNIGPELSKIGKSRSRRDLIEAVIFPSVRLAQSYQPMKIRTKDGEVVNGIVLKQDSTTIELQVAADKRVVIEVDEIEEKRPSEVSIMPAGLEQQLTLNELADLIAFLENAK